MPTVCPCAQMLERESNKEKNLEKAVKEAKAKARREAAAKSAAAGVGNDAAELEQVRVAGSCCSAGIVEQMMQWSHLHMLTKKRSQVVSRPEFACLAHITCCALFAAQHYVLRCLMPTTIKPPRSHMEAHPGFFLKSLCPVQLEKDFLKSIGVSTDE